MTHRFADLAPSLRYQQGAAAAEWAADPAQEATLAEFDRIYRAVQDAAQAKPSGLLGRLRGAFGASTPAPTVSGLYLWGSVGRGKTFLMDLFASSLPDTIVLRRHYHRFMSEVHERLRALGQRQDPLVEIAAELAADYRVLCLDEFLVQDIGDAMILAGLLEALFQRGLILVTTSNTEPQRLYADGLQRARFLPAIALLETHCHVHEMVSPRDWRLRTLTQAKVYLCPADAAAERQLGALFESQAQGEIACDGQLEIQGRAIPYRRLAEGVAWFSFDALCTGPRSVADYIALAKRFPQLVLSGVPRLDTGSENEARRFVLLVDEFYDRRVKLLLSAAAPITELYKGERLAAEFGRTESRLIEMQSEDYLAQPHRPETQ